MVCGTVPQVARRSACLSVGATGEFRVPTPRACSPSIGDDARAGRAPARRQRLLVVRQARARGQEAPRPQRHGALRRVRLARVDILDAELAAVGADAQRAYASARSDNPPRTPSRLSAPTPVASSRQRSASSLGASSPPARMPSRTRSRHRRGPARSGPSRACAAARAHQAVGRRPPLLWRARRPRRRLRRASRTRDC